MLLDDVKQCPFCKPNHEHIIADHEGAYLMRAVTPSGAVVPFRYQIVPYRHTTSLRMLPQGMASDKWILLEQVPEIAKGLNYNLSLNVGEAAGQRVAHVHEWVIVRNDGLGIGMSGMITALCDRRSTENAKILASKQPVYHEPGEYQF